MTEQSRIAIHFSPVILGRIGSSNDDLRGWVGAFHEWFYDQDPDWNFGRDVSNNPSGGSAYAWHLHMAPSEKEPDKSKLARWLRTEEAYYRTSDRLVIYSLDKKHPHQHGMLILDLVGDPDGHKICFEQPSSPILLQKWEDLAYTHQVAGYLPNGSVTISDSE
ncbi:hypothetical protein [Delftia acidovorans]|uniref:hypothetical protein n=1 Tax=Delftia acidovorans TaxID=80866 RepID=UPI003019D118